MSSQLRKQSLPGSQRREEPAISRRPKDKPLPPAALETQNSRRRRGRSSSLGNLVSRILPSRRAERGHTLRNEYRDDDPFSATDLVFGMTEPEEHPNIKDLKDMEDVNGGPHGIPRAQSHRSTVHKGHIRGRMEEPLHMPTENERAVADEEGISKKKKGKEKMLSMKSAPTRDDGDMPHDYTVSQQQQHPFHLSPLNFENDALGLNFQKSTPATEDAEEISKTQQIFAEKKARREQRKSLIESGDFLGVQGANPRTGYWDVSTATSSSNPSQPSYETKKKLEQQAKEVEEQRVMYEEAQAKYNAGLERAQTLKAKREADKLEQKRVQSRLKQRRRGRWNAGDNGWSSVAEPDLSPIGQSLVGSPVKG
jgi:hypothetical protein